jgi:hypothetical protein
MQETPVTIQTPTHWHLIGGSMTVPLRCYRPAVFFCHLRHISLSFPQEKIRGEFTNLTISAFKLLKLCKSEIAQLEIP